MNKIIILNKILLYLILSIFILICALIFAIKYGQYQSCKEAEAIAIKIDDFKIKQNRYPVSLNEIGKVEDRYYYQLLDENTYELSFGTTLGESAIYRSDERIWQNLSFQF